MGKADTREVEGDYVHPDCANDHVDLQWEHRAWTIFPQINEPHNSGVPEDR
jgi:hypothetical protein